MARNQSGRNSESPITPGGGSLLGSLFAPAAHIGGDPVPHSAHVQQVSPIETHVGHAPATSAPMTAAPVADTPPAAPSQYAPPAQKSQKSTPAPVKKKSGGCGCFVLIFAIWIAFSFFLTTGIDSCSSDDVASDDEMAYEDEGYDEGDYGEDDYDVEVTDEETD